MVAPLTVGNPGVSTAYDPDVPRTTTSFMKAPPILTVDRYNLDDHWVHRHRSSHGALVQVPGYKHRFAPATDSLPDFYPHNAAQLGFKILPSDPIAGWVVPRRDLTVKEGKDHAGEKVHFPFYYT